MVSNTCSSDVQRQQEGDKSNGFDDEQLCKIPDAFLEEEQKIIWLTDPDEKGVVKTIRTATELNLSVSKPLFLEEKETVTEAKEQQGRDKSKGVSDEQLREIRVAHQQLDEKKLEVIQKTTKEHPDFEELELRDCGLNENLLSTLHQQLKEANCNVSKLSISATVNLLPLMNIICNIVKTCRSRILCLEEGNISPEYLRMLKKALIEAMVTLPGLDLSYNQEMQKDFEPIGQILRLCHTTELRLVNCNLTDKEIESLADNSPHHCIEELNLSYNINITERGFSELGSILKKDTVKCLNLTGCDLEDHDVFTLCQSLRYSKIVHLNLSYNSTLEQDGIRTVGKMVQTNNVDELSLSGCDLKRSDIQCLRMSTQNCKMRKFDMSDNMSIGFGMEEVAEFVKQCSIADLDMSNCMLNSRQIEDFARSLGDYKLSRLNLSDSDRSVNLRHIQTIGNLIPNVEGEIIICFEHVEKGCKQYLKDTDCQGPKFVWNESEDKRRIAEKVELVFTTRK